MSIESDTHPADEASARPRRRRGLLAGSASARPRQRRQASDLDDLFLDTAPVFYKLRITTGDLRGAGTNEQVMIQLHGDSGSSGRHVIQAPLNRAETVEVMCEVHGELGRLQRMEVGFVDPESALHVKGSGWLLDRIETYRIDNSMRHMPKPVIFPCQRWIGESESGSRSGGPLQTLFPLAMELTVQRTPSKAAGASSADITMCAVAAGVPHPDKVAKGVKGFISKEFGYAGEDAYLVLCQTGSLPGAPPGLRGPRGRQQRRGISRSIFIFISVFIFINPERPRRKRRAQPQGSRERRVGPRP